VPADLQLPEGLSEPRIPFPGVLVVQGPGFTKGAGLKEMLDSWPGDKMVGEFPLVVVVDDSHFTTDSLANFLWVTFTRSNPATDIHGVGVLVQDKHWGCEGSLVIDARTKPHHAPPLREDPDITRRVDRLAAPGGPLHGII
jgi:4-hydroxy-3-polyprenylbenzoate decarboxylase